MRYSEHYNLYLPENAVDNVDVEVISSNFEVVDGKLKEHEEELDKRFKSEGEILATESGGTGISAKSMAEIANRLKKSIIIEATSEDGITYTATADGITELYNGLEITIIPNMRSTSKFTTLNLNNLGAKEIVLKINGLGTRITISAWPARDDWMEKSAPLSIRYIEGEDYWQATEYSWQHAEALAGIVKTSNGGTGKDSVTAGSFLVGNGVEAMEEKTPEEVLEAIGAAKCGNFEVTVPNDNWAITNSSALGLVQAKKTISVDGILATDNPITDVVLGTDYYANRLYIKAWECVGRIETSDNSITLYAYYKVPETAFNIQLKVVR